MSENANNNTRKRKANDSNMTNNILKLDRKFFDVPCLDLAKSLLGKVLIRRLEDNSILKGKIVETECYLGGIDKASHSHNGKRTPANEPMYMTPGTAYVYMTYGMYYCFNISSQGDGAVVLLRALTPLNGHEEMNRYRTAKRKSVKTKALKEHELCNGPSKLCISLNISKDLCNKLDLCENDQLWIEHDEDSDHSEIVITSRIGIESVGEEWAKKPLRFYINNNNCVSKRDKEAEKKLIVSE